MTLRDIYAVRGLDGVLDALEVYLAKVDALANQAKEPAAEDVAEAEEEETENG